MELKWLEDFISLAETRNFTRSAETRCTTQSAFSRRIKALEHWAGAPLFDRAQQPIRLTAAGELFRADAEELTRRFRDLRARVRQNLAEQQGTVTFAATHSLALHFFPRWLRELEREIGPVSTRLTSDDYDRMLDGLKHRRCDFLICHRTPWLSDLDPAEHDIMPLAEETLEPLSAPDGDGAPRHRLDEGPTDYLAYSEASSIGRALTGMLDARGEETLLVETFSSPYADVLRSLAVEGYGVAWLPASGAREDRKAGRLVRAGPPSWDVKLTVGLARSRGAALPKQAERVWQHAGAAARALPWSQV